MYAQIILGSLYSCYHAREMLTPYTPLLYSKIGVYRGTLFSYLCSKTLIVGTRLTIYVLSKNKKNIKFFHQKIIIFYSLKIAV